MSLLQALRDRQRSLKHTDTVVTRADGTRYLERRHSSAGVVPQPPGLGFVVDTAPDDRPALVVPHLYIGSQDCCTWATLREFRIESVLSVGVPAPCAPLAGVAFAFVPCLDVPEADLAPVLRECSAVIGRALRRRANVLVHCNAGVSRAAAVVVGYLVREARTPYDEALRLVRAARSCAQPNAGFVLQLRNL